MYLTNKVCMVFEFITLNNIYQLTVVFDKEVVVVFWPAVHHSYFYSIGWADPRVTNTWLAATDGCGMAAWFHFPDGGMHHTHTALAASLPGMQGEVVQREVYPLPWLSLDQPGICHWTAATLPRHQAGDVTVLGRGEEDGSRAETFLVWLVYNWSMHKKLVQILVLGMYKDKLSIHAQWVGDQRNGRF